VADGVHVGGQPSAELAGRPAGDRQGLNWDSMPWFHSIDLRDGRVTSGIKSPERLRFELDALNLPDDLTGLSVLDIGAWDGYFSFEAERRGAARVVALDHYAWALDWPAQRRYMADCKERGVAPQPFDQVDGLWRADDLPGRAGFELARSSLDSRVEPVVGDFMTMDLSTLGTFDVVLFLGVLYHLEDPLRTLRRLRRVTAGLAIIETVCAVFPAFEHKQMWEFFETDELDGDPSNWWAPNAAGLAGGCRAAGFQTVELKRHPGPLEPPAPGYEFHYGRAIVHAHP
jgi:tRNA (mo5U34)-methyltransferase